MTTSPQVFLPPRAMTARLAEKTAHNTRFVQYKFELVQPHEFQFQAGQYVSILVDPIGHRRSYSICSTPDVTHAFELLVDLTPQGMGTLYLQSLQLGQEVSMLAPMGRFIVPGEVTQSELVFVATGSGIAPFRSMILDQLQHLQQTKLITLHWGMRHAEDLFWLDEFGELMESFPQFRFHPVLSQAPDAWTLCRGRVTDCLSVHALPTSAAYFLCGNERMIADAKTVLQQRGVAATDIYNESFY